MGVSTEANRFVYNGDGSTVSFGFPDYFFSDTDFDVYIYDTLAGGITTLVLNTGYTVTGTPTYNGVNPDGGNIVATVAPLATDIIVIVRNPPQLQEYELLQNGQISSLALVQQFDYLTLLIQRLQDQINRGPSIPDGMGENFSNQIAGMPALSAQYYLTVNTTGDGWALVPGLSPVQNVVEAYTQFTSHAANSFNLPIFQIPAGNLLTYVVIKHTTAFQGTGITTCTASLGISGAFTQFINAFNVFQAASPTVYNSTVANFIGSFTSPTQVYLTLTTGAGLLNALTQGSLIVYYNFDSL